jgi:hypothetical protein
VPIRSREPAAPAAAPQRQAAVPPVARAEAPPLVPTGLLRPADVLRLQRTIGNRAVGRILAGARAPTSQGPAGAPTVQRALSHADQGAVGFGSRAGAGGRVAAAWLRTDGSRVGAVPQVDPPGYDYIRQLQLTNFWIRFHVVNNLAGGPGTANNLVPASKRDNSRYEVNVESAVKETVDDLAMTDNQVFFGAEVEYGGVAAGSQAQRNATPLFPTRITYYHETYDGDDDEWTWVSNGDTFDFMDAVPADPGQSINLSAITAQQLRQRVYNYAWDANDTAFINSLGTNNRAAFEELIDNNSEEGPAGSAAAALNDIAYSDQVTFGERIGDEDAIDALGAAIGRGFLKIA